MAANPSGRADGYRTSVWSRRSPPSRRSNHMKTITRLLAVASLSMAAAHCISSSAGNIPVNALWNDDSGFGIWLYPGPGKCPEARTRFKSFLVVGPGEHANGENPRIFTVSELDLCMEVGSDSNSPALLCRGGTLQLKYYEARGEYVGQYEFTLEDGSTRKGTFRAEHCKKNLG